MYGGTSVSDIIDEMGNTSYNNTKKGKLQQNLTNLLHAKKNCAKPDCAELREFIGKFIQYKMTRKNTPKSAKFGEAKTFPSKKTAKVPVQRTSYNVPRNANGKKLKPAGPNPKNIKAAENLASRAPPLSSAENKEAENEEANWNAARNLAGKAAAKENAADEPPPFTAENKEKLNDFLNNNDENTGSLGRTNTGSTNTGSTNGNDPPRPPFPPSSPNNATAEFNKNAKAPGFNNASVDAAKNRLATPVGSKKNKNGKFYFNNPVRALKKKRTRRNRR
jgi:hypothetical protein